MINIKIKKIDNNAKLPTKGSKGAIGYDLFLPHNIAIGEGEIRIVDLGFAIEIPDGYYVSIVPRSSIAAKYGVTIKNSPATIDSDYRGSIKVILHRAVEDNEHINFLSRVHFNKGTRIAQMIVHKEVETEFIEVSELTSTKRGEGGLGSTGL